LGGGGDAFSAAGWITDGAGRPTVGGAAGGVVAATVGGREGGAVGPFGRAKGKAMAAAVSSAAPTARFRQPGASLHRPRWPAWASAWVSG
jgi:hypothetical protein